MKQCTMSNVAIARLGTRKSILARWQTDHVRDLLQNVWPDLALEVQVFTTKGDRVLDTPLPLIGGKGLFTLELENALHSGEIDIAVHSLKDLPVESPAGLTIGAIPDRANPFDVLVSRNGQSLENLPQNATVGTSSRRRAAQLLHKRPDLCILDIRGNVDTRIRKTLDPDGPYDATILAYAGLERLERLDVVSQVLPSELMLPAPGQGALGVQCRDETASVELLAPINHRETAAAVQAERAFLAGLGGGCSTPVGAYAQVTNDTLNLQGRVSSPDGTAQVDVAIEGSANDAIQLGNELAKMALQEGADALLDSHSIN